MAALPIIGTAPILVRWFGFDWESKSAVVTVMVFFPMLINSGTRAGLAGGTTMVVDFALPNPGESLLDALKRWDNKSTRANCDYSFHMAVTWWGEQVFNDMKTVIEERGISTFKHFLAYKGALMVMGETVFLQVTI